ncbi:MAG: CYTH domain-containing protein, partial [bacterium]|nr:CYTH domain-containing protein [bacterium]
MSSFVEIEKRYQLLNKEITPCKKGFEWVSMEHVLDHYFDTPDGHYYQEGIFIRIRNGQTLDIKFNPDHLGNKHATDHVQCHEYTFKEPFKADEFEKFVHLKSLIKTQLPTGEDFIAFFSANHLIPLLTISKTRATYKRDDFLLVLDDIQGLDPILEVEYAGKTDGKNTQDIVRK